MAQTELTGQRPDEPLLVTVAHGGIVERISGTPENIIRQLIWYFSKLYPSLDLLSKLTLSVDDAEFLDCCSGIMASSQEGLVILKEIDGLRDKDLLSLHLAGARLMCLLSKRESDAMSLEELTRVTGRTTGTVAGRLNELYKEQLVERVGKGSYRLTTLGTRLLMKTLIPKLGEFPDR